MKKHFLLFGILMLIISKQVSALNPNHFTITRITAPYFVDDHNGNNLINKSYVGFEVTNNSNSGVTYSRLRFSISSILSSVVGSNYSVVGPSSGTIMVGTLAPGQSKVCYFYISYPTGGDPVATFNTILSDTTVNAKSTAFTIFNRNSISANAGGLSRQSVINQDVLGGFFTNDITYTVGNVRNGDEVDFQATIAPAFNPTQLQLVSTKVIASSIPGINIGTTDSLYFVTGQGRTGDSVKIRWKFRIVAPSFKAYMLPYSGATSGNTNYKFQVDNSLGLTGDSFAISSPANAITVIKKSDKRAYTICDTALFSLVIKNTSSFGITVDSLLDQLPANFSFIDFSSASSVQSSQCISNPTNGATGNIRFIGGVDGAQGASFFVPSNDSLVIKYTAKAPCSPQADQSTQISGFVGSTLFDIDSNTVRVVPPLPNIPVAVNDSFSTPIDQSISGNLTTNDTLSIDGGNVWSLFTNPANGLVTVFPNGTFTYIPSLGFAGVDTFYYKLCDLNGDCDTAYVVISVNDVPVAIQDSVVTSINTPIINANVSNNDTPSLDGGNIWTLVSTTSNGILTFRNDGTFDYSPNTGFTGSDTFYYRIIDANGDADTAMVVIRITTTTPVFDIKLFAKMISANKAQISWDVNCETGITSYQLERSKNGYGFETFNEEDINGECSSKTYQSFDLIDNTEELVYYRIKISHANGKYSYSNIFKLNVRSQNEINIMPNPFKDQLSIELSVPEKSKADVLLFSNLGRLEAKGTYTLVSGINRLKLDNIKVARGIHLVKILINGKQVKSDILIN